MHNRGGAGAAGGDPAAGKQQQTPSGASPAAAGARGEGKWVADRWGPTEKEADSKWGATHDPFERPRWTEDEGERGLGGGGRLARDAGR